MAAAPLCEAWDPNPRTPKLAVPAGAVDTHAHVFGPATRYAYAEDRRYTPPDALLSDYRRMLAALGVDRGVLVQPSVYGTDNTAMVDALAEAERTAPNTFRAVAVVDPDIPETELDRLHEAGVRGVRCNLLFRGADEFAAAEQIAPRLAERGWHLQVLIDVSDFAPGLGALARLPIDVVLDHMGHVPVANGIDHPGFRDVLALVREGRTWVKLSGAYRITGLEGAPYTDVVPFARALIEANPDRMVWGTDWPHPSIRTAMPNDGDLLDALADWTPDPDLQRKILVDNPEALYGF
ncbi:MAG: amidohydrolase family protein [Alphaproteobacteria bacterium]|nr:amidohydrolase family protein [Alphaproteobacteria bacterium]